MEVGAAWHRWGRPRDGVVVTMTQRLSSSGPVPTARRRATRTGLGALILAAGLLVIPVPANAAVSNDTWRRAERIGVGDELGQRTTAARSERLDLRVNRDCGAPRVGASVWFRVRTATTTRVLLDATPSDYSVGLMVFRGRPSPRSLVTCGPGQIGFRARAEQRYFVMAFDDSSRAGGRLMLSMSKVRKPAISLELSDTAVLDAAGTITLTGTVRCTNATFGGVDATLRQLVGRFYVIGYTFVEAGACDGTARELELPVTSDNGIFGLEPATVDVFASACGPFGCDEVVIDDHPVTVQEAVP